MLPNLLDQIEELKKRISILERYSRANTYITNEAPTGTINGTNTVFTTANNFVSGTTQVYRDGQLLVGGGADYTETDVNEITFITAPVSGSVLVVCYQTLSTFASNANADTLDGQHSTYFKSDVQPYVSLYRSAALNIANTTNTALTWDGVTSNDYGMYSSGSPTRVTIQVAGMYLVTGIVGYQGSIVGNRIVYIYKNGSLFHLTNTTATNSSANSIGLNASVPLYLQPNDYLELGTYQNSGGDLALWTGESEYRSPRFIVIRM